MRLKMGFYLRRNCYMYLLDLLGKTMENPAVKAFQKRFPHYDLEATDRGTVDGIGEL
jgi:hypoxia up-regulated 1